jgi:hypothetical protein
MKTGAGEAEKLQREIGGRRSRHGALPRELRERATAYARARAATGATTASVAAEVGMSAKTVERWLRAAAPAALVPVRIVDVGRASKPALPAPVVTTPSGLRVEGLDLDALCTLVMRCG